MSLLVAIALLAGCGGADAERALARWFAAVQALDLATLAAVDASAPPGPPPAPDAAPSAPFERWATEVRSVIARFEEERDDGRFTTDPRGYALVRAAGLGKGAFWQVERARDLPGGTVLTLRVNFGYGEIPYGSLPPGTVVYLLGHPPGTIHAIELGRGRRVRMDVLEHAFLEARLVRRGASGGSGSALAVASLGWADEPPIHAPVEWIF